MTNTNFCSGCGNRLAPGAAFCNSCGKPVARANSGNPNMDQPNYNPQPGYGQPNYSQPNYSQPNYGQPNYSQPGYNPQPGYIPQPPLPMNWHNALVKWLMIVWGISYLIGAVSYFTGFVFFAAEDLVEFSSLSRAVDWLYDILPGLQTVSILGGLSSLAFAGLCFYTFPKLKQFKMEGLKLFKGMMIASIVVEVIITVAIAAIISEEGVDPDASLFVSLFRVIIFASANLVYYKKREHLFK
ncbi:MAG: hypothetical protein IJO09_04285 [Oscillospiraceae bacterium]|nr:hypothetical protein [Oscillospiraceae bacterium]